MISFNYISANERSTFNDSITVAADPEGTYCYIGYNTTNKILSSTLNKKPDFNYDAFIIVEGDANNSPLLITHGKVIELTGGSNYEAIMNALNNKADASVVDAISGRVLSLESNPRIFNVSDENNLPSDIRDGDLVEVVSKGERSSYGTVEVSVTNLENGYPNFEPTNGNYLVSDEIDLKDEHLSKYGFDLIEISTYNPLYKIVLNLTADGFDKWLTLPQESYTVNNDGVVQIPRNKFELALAQMTQEEIETWIGDGDNASAYLYVVMEKPETIVSDSMSVVAYEQKTKLYTRLNDRLYSECDELERYVDEQDAAEALRVSRIESKIPTEVLGNQIVNGKAEIPEIDVEGYDSDGYLRIVGQDADHPYRGTHLALVYANIPIYPNTRCRWYADSDSENYIRYGSLKDMQDREFIGYIGKSYAVVDHGYINLLCENSHDQYHISLRTADSDTESEYGVQSGEKYTIIQANSEDASFEIPANVSTFTVIFNGINYAETNIYFDGATTIDFIIGDSTYDIVGEVPNFEAGTKYVMAIKDNYVVFGTVAADEEEEE